MIVNLVRTSLQLGGYLSKIQYPWIRILIYTLVSIIVGVLLSNSSRAAEIPILTLTAILFGFTINAVVMLGNSSEHYLLGDRKHSDQIKSYYEKTLYISIHTLGIGIITIIVTGVFQLFPEFNHILVEMQFGGHALEIELISSMVYTLVVYYLIIFQLLSLQWPNWS